MERKNPGLFSASTRVRSHRGGAAPAENGHVTVLVWDCNALRLQAIERVVVDCAARIRLINELATLDHIALSSTCAVAVVGMDGPPSTDDPEFDAIRLLRQKGFNIISCAHGARSWPVGIQCQPLLCGSLRLLDSATADFPLQLRRLIEQLLQAESSRRGEDEKIKAAMNDLGIVGNSRSMISIFRWILRVSVLSDLPILITGETGTGKQILANAIYRLDPKRQSGPLVAVNCGAISPGLAESELFGHRRGAFTGAERDRKGLIRSAHGGIVFLDEIGELTAELQTKLLRVLQEKRVLGVGDDHETPVDVRVIAATNRDLDNMVQERKFRADLFHRISVLHIQIPPLRERPADVKPLVEHFLHTYRSLNPAPLSAGADFLQALGELKLSGNVRQLENLVRQAVIQKNDNGPLHLGDLPLEVWRELSMPRPSPSPNFASAAAPIEPPHHSTSSISGVQLFSTRRASGRSKEEADLAAHIMSLLNANGWSLSQSLEYCEKLLLQAALQQARGNQTSTAKLLGITPRSVYNKYRKHNLLR